LNKPLHTGFFLKLWDQMFGSLYEEGPDTCLCSRCSTARGERTREAYDAVEKPDYSVLRRPSYWWYGDKEKNPRAAEQLAV
jgi:lathosterol oxidase